MPKSLFLQLKEIGIDEQLAHEVSASLDPDYNATKKDVLIMQEAIMQVQLQSERNYNSLRSEISDVRAEVSDVRAEVSDVRAEVSDVRAEVSDVRAEIAGVRNEVSAVRAEMGGMHRQYWITFGGLITTILSVFFVNWYFH